MTYRQALAIASFDTLYDEGQECRLLVLPREECDAVRGRWYEVIVGPEYTRWVSVYARPNSWRLLFYLDTNTPQRYPLPEEYKVLNGWQIFTREEFEQFNRSR